MNIAQPTQILALDTSLSKSGWAVLSVKDRRASVVDYGLIKTNAKLTDGERLRQIVDGIHEVLSKYPNIDRTIPREEGMVFGFPTATKQIFKSHGVTEYALEDYDIADVNIQSVKAWAAKVTGVKAKGSKETKANVANAVMQTLGLSEIKSNTGGDVSDAMAVGIVYLKREGLIN